MPSPVQRRVVGDVIAVSDFNTISSQANALIKMAGGQDTRFSINPSGVAISGTRPRQFTGEPAITAYAYNGSGADMGALNVVQIAWPYLDEHQPVGTDYIIGERIVEVTMPVDSGCGNFGVVLDLIPDGQVGKVLIAGICLAWIDGYGVTGFDIDVSDSADTYEDHAYLIPNAVGAAKVLWVSGYIRPEAPRRLAVIKLGQRSTNGVGISQRGFSLNNGVAEVIRFDAGITVTRLGPGRVRIQPA